MPAVGKMRTVAPVVLSVIELAPVVMKASAKATVLPAAKVNVPELAVMVLPLIEVARAAPKVGVTKVGELLKTSKPEPLGLVIFASS